MGYTKRKSYVKTNMSKSRKMGGSGKVKTFNTKHEITRYIEKNYSWMKRINVYTKSGFKKREPAVYEFTKYEFPHIFRIGDLKQYKFIIY